MPVISRETSVAATTTVDNLLSGSAFEFARGPQLVSLGVTAAATGTFITFTSGADVILEESAPVVATRYPLIPDEFYFSDVAAPGDRYVLRVRNTTGAAIIVRAVLQIQDVLVIPRQYVGQPDTPASWGPPWSSMGSRRRRSPPTTPGLCGPVSQLVLRNRGAGPFGLLNLVDERCGGTFDNIDDVIPPKERTEFMAAYKAAAGFAIESLNKAPPTIPSGARARAAN